MGAEEKDKVWSKTSASYIVFSLCFTQLLYENTQNFILASYKKKK